MCISASKTRLWVKIRIQHIILPCVKPLEDVSQQTDKQLLNYRYHVLSSTSRLLLGNWRDLTLYSVPARPQFLLSSQVNFCQKLWHSLPRHKQKLCTSLPGHWQSSREGWYAKASPQISNTNLKSGTQRYNGLLMVLPCFGKDTEPSPNTSLRQSVAMLRCKMFPPYIYNPKSARSTLLQTSQRLVFNKGCKAFP